MMSFTFSSIDFSAIKFRLLFVSARCYGRLSSLANNFFPSSLRADFLPQAVLKIRGPYMTIPPSTVTIWPVM
jgi:hypothetical protein